ncbi:hypothetical protein [Halomontanus rarus]|nr:hypothetical protein [Halovivax sp. TS33]
MESNARTKAAGVCEDCGKAFAVFESEDGDVIPIGSRDGCPCGGTSFHVL